MQYNKWIKLFLIALLCLPCASVLSASVSAQTLSKDKAAKTGAPALVDINQATRAELEAIPWIGPIRAGKILRGRPYRNKTDLVTKKVLTKREYELMKNKIVARHS